MANKANKKLGKARKTVTKAQRNYEMQKQSLQDFGKYASKDMDMVRLPRPMPEEKANAEGELRRPLLTCIGTAG